MPVSIFVSPKVVGMILQDDFTQQPMIDAELKENIKSQMSSIVKIPGFGLLSFTMRKDAYFWIP